MEGRCEQFVAEIVAQEGVTPAIAKKQVAEAIDTWVWYAGWTDKISVLDGSTNPVAGPYYNFTIPEAIGVVAIFADGKPSLLNLVNGLAPVIASGNTAILMASEKFPLSAITLAEALATSDLPAGVINIITGKTEELVSWAGSHMDIDAIDASSLTSKQIKQAQELGAENLKRIHSFDGKASPLRITSFMESKTVWHPVGI